MVVMCIDVSGSMSTSYEVPQGVDLPGRGKVKYVTRLDCIKAAAHAQLVQLAKDAPDTVVSFVLFGSSAKV